MNGKSYIISSKLLIPIFLLPLISCNDTSSSCNESSSKIKGINQATERHGSQEVESEKEEQDGARLVDQLMNGGIINYVDTMHFIYQIPHPACFGDVPEIDTIGGYSVAKFKMPQNISLALYASDALGRPSIDEAYESLKEDKNYWGVSIGSDENDISWLSFEKEINDSTFLFKKTFVIYDAPENISTYVCYEFTYSKKYAFDFGNFIGDLKRNLSVHAEKVCPSQCSQENNILENGVNPQAAIDHRSEYIEAQPSPGEERYKLWARIMFGGLGNGTPGRGERVHCPDCGATFDSYSAMRSHQNAYHDK